MVITSILILSPVIVVGIYTMIKIIRKKPMAPLPPFFFSVTPEGIAVLGLTLLTYHALRLTLERREETRLAC